MWLNLRDVRALKGSVTVLGGCDECAGLDLDVLCFFA